MSKPKRVALYLRVSTAAGQTTANQRRELEQVAKQRNWKIVDVYNDVGISGSKGRELRPELNRLHEDMTRGRFDLVAAWSIDRLGRSISQLVQFIDELHSVNVDLYLHQQAIDTSSASGKLFYSISAAFAEFERSIIRERVLSGIKRAKASGKVFGRPKVSKGTESAIRLLRERGMGIKAIAKELGVGNGTVSRVVNAGVAEKKVA